MDYSVLENAHTVLLPAFSTTQLSPAVKNFLDHGGRSILLGETREEYVARRMNRQRELDETNETIINITTEARSRAGNIIVAVDQEIAGICRLHNLVPPFPAKEELKAMSIDDFETACKKTALAARALGVNCFLGPILDIVTGISPWLQGRTWSTTPELVARISSSYIRALQANNIAAAAKHFPGYSHIELDPAIDPEAKNRAPLDSFDSGFFPFADAIDNGVEIIMTGPAIVEAFDPENAASVSSAVISLLRNNLQFNGLVLSDDLDAKAILRGKPINQIAVEALNAGSELLLVGDREDQIGQLATAIITAVDSGHLDTNLLHKAAAKVRTLSDKYQL